VDPSPDDRLLIPSPKIIGVGLAHGDLQRSDARVGPTRGYPDRRRVGAGLAPPAEVVSAPL